MLFSVLRKIPEVIHTEVVDKFVISSFKSIHISIPIGCETQRSEERVKSGRFSKEGYGLKRAVLPIMMMMMMMYHHQTGS
jgi:hypothetical protein